MVRCFRRGAGGGRIRHPIGGAADAEAAVAVEGAVAPKARQRRQVDRHANRRAGHRPHHRETGPRVASRQRGVDPTVGIKPQIFGDFAPGAPDQGIASGADRVGQLARHQREAAGAVHLPNKAMRLQTARIGRHRRETDRGRPSDRLGRAVDRVGSRLSQHGWRVDRFVGFEDPGVKKRRVEA
jgi:hypothetical protein